MVVKSLTNFCLVHLLGYFLLEEEGRLSVMFNVSLRIFLTLSAFEPLSYQGKCECAGKQGLQIDSCTIVDYLLVYYRKNDFNYLYQQFF